jgi:hypothetical protein
MDIAGSGQKEGKKIFVVFTEDGVGADGSCREDKGGG